MQNIIDLLKMFKLHYLYLLLHNLIITFLILVILYVVYRRQFWKRNKVKIMDRLMTSKSYKKMANTLPILDKEQKWWNFFNYIRGDLSVHIEAFINTRWTNPNDVNRVLRSDEITKTMYMKVMYLISKGEDLNIPYPHELMNEYHTMSSYIIKLKLIYQLRNLRKEVVTQVMDRALIYEESLGEIKSWMSTEISFKNIKNTILSFHWLILYAVDEVFLHLHLFDILNNSTRFFFHNLIDWFYTSLKIHIVLYMSIIFNQLIYLAIRSSIETNVNLFELYRSELINYNSNDSFNDSNNIFNVSNNYTTEFLCHTITNITYINNVDFSSSNHSLNYNYSYNTDFQTLLTNITNCSFVNTDIIIQNIVNNTIYDIDMNNTINNNYSYNISNISIGLDDILTDKLNNLYLTIDNIYNIINYALYIIIRFFTFKDIVFLSVSTIKMIILAIKKYWKIIKVSSSAVFKIFNYSYKTIILFIKTLKNAYKMMFYQKMDIQKVIKILRRFNIREYLIYIIENYIKWIVYQFRIILYAFLILVLGLIIRGMDWINMKFVGKQTKMIFDEEQLQNLEYFYWLFLVYNLYKSTYPETIIGKLVAFVLLVVIQGRLIF